MLRAIKLNYLVVAIISITALLLCVNFSDASNSNKEASRFVAEMSDQVMQIAENQNLSEQDKSSQLKKIFNNIVDIQWIGRFAMGKNWRNLSEQQKNLFMSLYPDYLTKSYVKNFNEINKNTIKVISVNSTSEREYIVFTSITNKINNTSVNVNFRLIQNGETYKDFKIFDIIAEGVSLISTQRNEFNEIMSNGGFDELIKRIRQHKIGR